MLVGIAGILWLITQKGFPIKEVLQIDKIQPRLLIAKKWITEHGMPLAEKILRQAKIYTMRLERFFAAKLEILVARKKNTPDTKPEKPASFWDEIRKPNKKAAKGKNSDEAKDKSSDPNADHRS